MRTPIERIRLSARGAEVDLAALSREFPTVAIDVATDFATQSATDFETSRSDRARENPPLIRAIDWVRVDDPRSFDDAVTSSSSSTIHLAGDDASAAPRAACELLTRYQRFVGRRNEASRTALFDRVLEAHANLHDRSKPLVLADHDHAVDTWQWMLRLRPDASLDAQLAALFHDIERLATEADRRVEQHATNYQAFKDAHAASGAEWMRRVLADVGVDAATRDRAAALVATHERRTADPDVALLNDADGLSFFSLNASGYVDYFGIEQTFRKVRYTFDRLGVEARRRLDTVKIRADVRRLLDGVRGESR